VSYRILVSDALDPLALAWLAEQPDVEVDAQPKISPTALRQRLGRYDALIVRSRTVVGPAELAVSGSLQVIGRAGTGLDNIALTEAATRGVTVLNTPGANAAAVAELTLGFLLAIARDLPRVITTKEKALGMELDNKQLGIMGFGQIGRRVARLAHAFGMRVVAYDVVDCQAAARELGVAMLDLNSLLTGSHFASLHMPLTAETRELIDERALAHMPQGASLINTARAEIVDEAAIVRALDAERLYRYAADLYQPDSPLLQHPKALLTPHIGASTAEAQRRAGLEIAQRVITTLRERDKGRRS
jgi:D-3-phosphoglycerate dehydrogenase